MPSPGQAAAHLHTRRSGGCRAGALCGSAGATETEVKEREDRVDDALQATEAALAEGVVAGGGVALICSLKALDTLKPGKDDQPVGSGIVRKAPRAPAREIAESAGIDGAIVAARILETDQPSRGLDAQATAHRDLVGRGIIDPTKVVRAAIQDAASMAGISSQLDREITRKTLPGCDWGARARRRVVRESTPCLPPPSRSPRPRSSTTASTGFAMPIAISTGRSFCAPS